jgi:hypothetical protein
MIEAIRNILRYSKAIVLLSAVASLVSGACNVYLVAMVGATINAMPNIPRGYGARFGGLLLLTLGSSLLAQVLCVPAVSPREKRNYLRSHLGVRFCLA